MPAGRAYTFKTGKIYASDKENTVSMTDGHNNIQWSTTQPDIVTEPGGLYSVGEPTLSPTEKFAVLYLWKGIDIQEINKSSDIKEGG